MDPNLAMFRALNRALDPPKRVPLSRQDRRVLREVETDESSTVLSSRHLPAPKLKFEHDPDRPHWSEGLPEPLDDTELEAVGLNYEVWVLDHRGRSGLVSRHRVGPMKLFGIKRPYFPNEDQLRIADEQSRLCAQRAGYEYLARGAKRVDIRSYRRKASKSRRFPQAGETNWVATMTSVDDPPWILGDFMDESLGLDAGYGV